MSRFVLAGSLTAVALIIAIFAGWLSEEITAADMLVNLSAEVVGIALTVAIVDWLIERNKLAEEAQRVAWRVLHELDQAIWVWQGGRQEFHLDEMAALIDLIAEDDHPIESTQDLFVNLGRTTSDTVRLHAKLMRHDKRLREALTALTGLAQMRALKGRMPRTFVVEAMRRALYGLAEVTGQAIHSGTFGVVRTFRDSSAEAQRQRYEGWRFGGIAHRPGADPTDESTPGTG